MALNRVSHSRVDWIAPRSRYEGNSIPCSSQRFPACFGQSPNRVEPSSPINNTEGGITMQTNALKRNIRRVCGSIAGAVGAGAVLLLAASAPAQNLFEADIGSSDTNEPRGASRVAMAHFRCWSP
jgi:hypothetical protein